MQPRLSASQTFTQAGNYKIVGSANPGCSHYERYLLLVTNQLKHWGQVVLSLVCAGAEMWTISSRIRDPPADPSYCASRSPTDGEETHVLCRRAPLYMRSSFALKSAPGSALSLRSDVMSSTKTSHRLYKTLVFVEQDSRFSKTRPAVIISIKMGSHATSTLETGGDKVTPVYAFDDTALNRIMPVCQVLRFPVIMDADVLRTSLEALLDTGDWRKLRGRWRLDVSLY